MFLQINCLLVFLLVAGSQGAPAPEKFETLYTYHGAVQTNSKLRGGAKAGLNGALVNGTATGSATGSVSGQAGASVIVVDGDKAYETGVKYNGVAGGHGKISGKGKLGVVEGKNAVATGNADTRTNIKHASAGGAFLNTQQDAMENFNNVYNLRANDILEEMDSGEDN